MAHFAKLDENNVVTTVLKVSNKSIKDAYGVEQEQLGDIRGTKMLIKQIIPRVGSFLKMKLKMKID